MPDFATLFGRPPALTARAPGRVNLIGEHTDYNQGYVLPTVIPQQTAIELAPSDGKTVRVWSADVPTPRIETYLLGSESRGRGWLDYVQGVTQTLAGQLGGFDARISSTVPLGGGLSSSAALEIALLRGLRSLFRLQLDDVALARLGQRAEQNLVGAPVGIMDQMASSLGQPGMALFLDTRDLAYDALPLWSNCELLVIDSGFTHEHAGGEYSQRRKECEEAARYLGVSSLRELDEADLGRLAGLPAPLDRRARHVITENQRVLDTVAALRAQDLSDIGRIFAASHASMRDDFEVSIPPIDRLVAMAASESDILGARLTGGGFGGAVVLLAKPGRARAVGDELVRRYDAEIGRKSRVLVPQDSLIAPSSK